MVIDSGELLVCGCFVFICLHTFRVVTSQTLPPSVIVSRCYLYFVLFVFSIGLPSLMYGALDEGWNFIESVLGTRSTGGQTLPHPSELEP